MDATSSGGPRSPRRPSPGSGRRSTTEGRPCPMPTRGERGPTSRSSTTRAWPRSTSWCSRPGGCGSSRSRATPAPSQATPTPGRGGAPTAVISPTTTLIGCDRKAKHIKSLLQRTGNRAGDDDGALRRPGRAVGGLRLLGAALLGPGWEPARIAADVGSVPALDDEAFRCQRTRDTDAPQQVREGV